MGDQVFAEKDIMPISGACSRVTKDSCSVHKDTETTWHCKSHGVDLCGFYQYAEYEKCTIDKTSPSNINSNAINLTNMKTRAVNLKQEFYNQLTELKANASEIEVLYAMTLCNVARRLTQIRNKDRNVMEYLEINCDACISAITGLLSELDLMEALEVKEEAFLTFQNVESQLQCLEAVVKSIKSVKEITKYQLVKKIFRTNSGLLRTINDQMYKRTPIKLEGITLKTSTDTYDCWITGISILGDNKLVVADRENRKLKLVDTTRGRVRSEVQIGENVWDVTKIADKDELIVSCDRSICFVSITETKFLSVTGRIDKTYFKYCQGLVYINGLMAVSYCQPNKMEMLDLHGNVKEKIDGTDKDGNVRFYDVGYIDKYFGTNIFYLSDWSRNIIIGMTRDGEILFTFNHQHLKWPKGITVGRDGRIFVCSYKNHKIYELSTDLTKGEIILDGKNGIKYPYSIVYDDEEHILYIGSTNNLQAFLV